MMEKRLINGVKNHLYQDIIIIVVGIVFAIWLAKSGTIDRLIGFTGGFWIISSFVAGSFFTSAFTTAPAIAILGELGQTNPIFWTAFFGGLGALLGDFILFKFVRDRFTNDLMALIGKRGSEKLAHIFHRKLFRWFSPFVAAFIIASPLPDELGVTILGLVKSRAFIFIPFSFLANFFGILVIALIARAAL